MRRAITVITSAVAMCSMVMLAAPAKAEPVSAVIADSSATVQLPLFLPSKYECVKYPYSYTLAPDVNFATVTIVDAYKANLASDFLMAAGAGSGSLQVCSFEVEGKQAPYTLNLEITYKYESGKPSQIASSAPFALQGKGSGTVKCKKTSSPKKGSVKIFKASKCPSGWLKVS